MGEKGKEDPLRALHSLLLGPNRHHLRSEMLLASKTKLANHNECDAEP